jgi:hypothetical protein
MDEADAGAALTARRDRARFELYRSRGERMWVDAAGGSMLPLVPAGTKMLVDFAATRARVGEIVLFPLFGLVVAHRLVRSRQGPSGEVLVTRGDALLRFDPSFPPEQMLGVVRAVVRRVDMPLEVFAVTGRGAAVLGVVSRQLGYLYVAVTRLPAPIRGPLLRPGGWFATALLSGTARLIAAVGRLVPAPSEV